jgi:hypothetical protein
MGCGAQWRDLEAAYKSIMFKYIHYMSYTTRSHKLIVSAFQKVNASLWNPKYTFETGWIFGEFALG